MATAATLEDEPVRIVPYDPAWPARFEREKLLLERSIGAAVTGGIHHVGSTAVPGLSAKPVIDILVGVQDLVSSCACFAPLRELSYQHAAHRSEEMHWFCKPEPRHRTHYLHLVPTGSRRYEAELSFRDALRSSSALAADYKTLKTSLARRHEHDRERYTQEKAQFIARALREWELGTRDV